MISIESFKQKYEKLMSLSSKHPSFTHNFPIYLGYIESHLPAFGPIGTKMFDDLTDKLVDNKQVDTMRGMSLEVRRIGRSREILLDRQPLVNYVFARTMSAKFIKEVKPATFFDVEVAMLFKNKQIYVDALQKTFEVMKCADDYFTYYSDFRRSVLMMVGNGILSAEDVAKYIPVIEKFESIIEEVNRELDISGPALDINTDPDQLSSMNAFGTTKEVLIDKNGTVSPRAIINFLQGGSDYLLKLSKSSVQSDYSCYEGLINLMSAAEYDPICDYIMDAQSGTALLYHHNRRTIMGSQRLCQSILNIFTPDLLVQTALSDYYDITLTKCQYDLASLLETVDKNLSLLQAYGIITMETHNSFLEKINNELS